MVVLWWGAVSYERGTPVPGTVVRADGESALAHLFARAGELYGLGSRRTRTGCEAVPHPLRERERGRERETERQRDRGIVCEIERDRENARKRVCARERVCERERDSVCERVRV